MEEISILLLKEDELSKFWHQIPDKLKLMMKQEDMITLGIAGPENIAMGVAVFREYVHYMELVWLYVEPEFRGMGFGKALVKRMEDTLADSDYFIGIFADYMETKDWELDYFLKALGYEREKKDWSVYQMNLSDVRTLDVYLENEKKAGKLRGLCSISDCSDVMKKQFSFMLYNNDEINFVELPINWRDYSEELSCVYVDKGVISAVLLIKNTENRIVIEFAYAKMNPYVFPYMLCYSYDKAKSMYQGTDPEIIITVLNDSTEKLLLKLVPGAWNKTMIHAEKRLYKG